MNIKYLSFRSKNVTCSRRKIWFWLQGTLDRPSKVKPLNKRRAWTCQLLEHFLCLLVCEQRGKVVRFTIFLLGLRFKTKSFGSPWEKINYNGGTLKARRKKAVERRYCFIIFTNNGKNDFSCTSCDTVDVVRLGNFHRIAFTLWITTLTSDYTL